MLTFFVVVFAAIVFEYSNGFHYAPNAIATVVSTKVLTPRQAIVMAAIFNLTGAPFAAPSLLPLGKVWSILTSLPWRRCCARLSLPSLGILRRGGSVYRRVSSHALIGGLCGAALVTARGNWSVLKWNSGLWPKVVIPMITLPLAGFFLGALVMFALFLIFRRFSRCTVSLPKRARLSLTASVYGIPLSTTHVISTSLMGVGAAKRFSGVKWTVVERIIWTWILTLPATGLIGFILARTVAAL